jgi:hypothetical protein
MMQPGTIDDDDNAPWADRMDRLNTARRLFIARLSICREAGASFVAQEAVLAFGF